MRQTARLTILYVFLCAVMFGNFLQHAHAIRPNAIYGGSADATIPPVVVKPCTTLGYNVETTLTFPIFGDTPITNQAVVEKSHRSDRVGYYVTRNNTNSTEVWVYSYDAVAMTAISNVQLQAFGQLDYGNQRVADVYNNELYIVRNINGGRRGCGVGRTCVSITKISPTGTISEGLTLDLVTLSFSGLDDFTILSDGTAYLGFGDNFGGRRLAVFDAPSQFFIGFGPALTGFSSSIVFAYRENGSPSLYVGELLGTDVTAVSFGSTTPSIASTYSYVASNTTQALTTALSQNFLLGASNSFGGIAANIAYKDLSLVTSQSTASYLNSADGSALRGGTYYDAVNNVLHSIRIDAGAGAPNIIRSTVFPFTVQQRYSGCGTSCQNNGYRTYDYVFPTARFYFGTNNGFVNAIITRVKVCATGGPAA